ncbi:hypothetical protein [Lysobacter gummosus]|uniref:hypothetical protein n=1 Tax=Lysobacter gummosus TaxID=262324 RepID=UPI0036291198
MGCAPEWTGRGGGRDPGVELSMRAAGPRFRAAPSLRNGSAHKSQGRRSPHMTDDTLPRLRTGLSSWDRAGDRRRRPATRAAVSSSTPSSPGRSAP